MSRINWVVPEAKASILPLMLGTTAMFEVVNPSRAFRVETTGCSLLSGHSVRKLKVGEGKTVALKTYACEVVGIAQGPSTTSTGGFRLPLKGVPLPIERVSSVRHGTAGYRDSPPDSNGAK